MCGIVGIVSHNENVTEILLELLKRLEYRGYDSAGIAIVGSGKIERCRAAGKLVNLVNKVAQDPRFKANSQNLTQNLIGGLTGIGHTRWATHGLPNTENAHPHATSAVAIVHNGIIENYSPLRQELIIKGSKFETETDTEVVLHLIDQGLQQGLRPLAALQATVKRLQGNFAIAAVFADHPKLMLGAKRGSPLAVGFAEDKVLLGSDGVTLSPYVNHITYLEEGDIVEFNDQQVCFYDENLTPVKREKKASLINNAASGKGNYRHFMLKEIFDQPAAINDTIGAYLKNQTINILGEKWNNIKRIVIVACGTSYYAGLVAKYWFEKWAEINTEVDLASEFRYRCAPLAEDSLYIFISQSGETADTLAAAEYVRNNCAKANTVAIVNVEESALTRKVSNVLPTYAGPEIGVASTKAFTTQLIVLGLLALEKLEHSGKEHQSNAPVAKKEALRFIPGNISQVLNKLEPFEQIAQELQYARDILYLGRQLMYPVALEGALKMKELSYIHAEGYAAGEMKHGPISLIDKEMPIIALAPYDSVFEKTLSNLHTVKARGARLIAITDNAGEKLLGNICDRLIVLPQVNEFVSPFVYSIAMQLLAYYTAVLKGADIDQPRNLAKSVTVE